MQWIILIGDEKLTLERIKSIDHTESVSCHYVENDSYCVDYGMDHIIYRLYEDIINDYEEDELDILKKLPFKIIKFIIMKYTSKERMKKVIQQENFLKNIYVDNDHWLITPIDEFIRLGCPTERAKDG